MENSDLLSVSRSRHKVRFWGASYCVTGVPPVVANGVISPKSNFLRQGTEKALLDLMSVS
ncbi:MAG: hypothetical protein AAFW70_19770 [Cyanobacteria bacterium J06635_10]